MIIAHISDLHCGRSWMFKRDYLDKAIGLIRDVDPDVTLITGDLTDWGLESEFEEALSFLDKLNEPWYTVPGNHDGRHEGYKVFERLWRRPSRIFVQEQDKLVIAGLDSSEPDIDDGHVGREQTDWLGKQLRETDPEYLPVVFLHHHLVPVPNTGRERNVLVDSGEVLLRLFDYGVPLILTGHKHTPWVWNLNGLIVSTAGTVSCERTAIPNSFSIIRIENQDIEISQHILATDKRETIYKGWLAPRSNARERV
ncbi:MAG: metallophosphoesterase family protein [Thermoplasmata archaeon]